MGFTSAERPLQLVAAEERDRAEAEADEAEWATPAATGSTDESVDESVEGEDALGRNEQEGADNVVRITVKAAVLTDDVVEVCQGSAVCERLSNVDNTLSGSSFQDVQDLLDSLGVAPSQR